MCVELQFLWATFGWFSLFCLIVAVGLLHQRIFYVVVGRHGVSNINKIIDTVIFFGHSMWYWCCWCTRYICGFCDKLCICCFSGLLYFLFRFVWTILFLLYFCFLLLLYFSYLICDFLNKRFFFTTVLFSCFLLLFSLFHFFCPMWHKYKGNIKDRTPCRDWSACTLVWRCFLFSCLFFICW